jgi:hypothetical protein
MGHRKYLLIPALLLSCGSLPRREIHGIVLEADGKPAAGAVIGSTVGLGWNPTTGTVELRMEAVTDPEGRFMGRVRWTEGENVLLAASLDRRRGALVRFSGEAPEKELSIRLAPLIEVRAQFNAERLDPGAQRPPLDAIDCQLADESGKRVAEWRMKQATFVLKLPPGRYTLTAGGTFSLVEKTFTLAADKPSVDLGKIDLDRTYLERLAAKAPPAWNVTAALGAPASVQASDYLGKWLLVEFWAHDCEASVRKRLPEWARFCEKHALERDRFEIVAIHHSKDVGSLAELEEKLRKEWGGAWKPMPFPVLVDATPKTFVSSEINHLPASILVDPAGRIEGLGDVARLEHKLKLPWPLPR